MIAVAKCETLDIGGQPHQPDPHYRSGVDEVDHPGFRSQTAHVIRHPERFGKFAHGTENTAGADGVAGTHGHTVFQRDPGVDGAVIGVAERERQDDEISVLQHFAAVGGTDHFRAVAGVFFGVAGELHHGVEHGRVGVDQRQSALAQDFAVDHVVDNRSAEEITAGSDYDDFWTFFHFIVSNLVQW